MKNILSIIVLWSLLIVVPGFAQKQPLDAFGRVQVSNPNSRGDVEFIYDAQPLLYDNISTGNGALTHRPDERDLEPTAAMVAICATVKSEGGAPLFDMPGFPVSTTTPVVPPTVDNSGDYEPVLSIQVADTFKTYENGTLIIPKSIKIATNNEINYEIRYRCSLTGADFDPVDTTYSAVNVDNTATAVAGGLLLKSNHLGAGKNVTILTDAALGRIFMTRGHLGTPDILNVSAIATSASAADVHVSIQWEELR